MSDYEYDDFDDDFVVGDDYESFDYEQPPIPESNNDLERTTYRQVTEQIGAEEFSRKETEIYNLTKSGYFAQIRAFAFGNVSIDKFVVGKNIEYNNTIPIKSIVDKLGKDFEILNNSLLVIAWLYNKKYGESSSEFKKFYEKFFTNKNKKLYMSIKTSRLDNRAITFVDTHTKKPSNSENSFFISEYDLIRYIRLLRKI